MLKPKRIEWADGLKGGACFLIFIHHFLVAFFPASYFGNMTVVHGSLEWDLKLSQEWWGVIVNGNFWVCVFCLLSGLVQSYSIFAKNDYESLSRSMIKRYFRLALPIFVFSFFVYFLLYFNCFSHLQANEMAQSPWFGGLYTAPVSFRSIFTDSLIRVWLTENTTFSTAFWMLHHVFLGSFLTYCISIIAMRKEKRVLIVYLGLFVGFWVTQSYMLCFVLGAFMAYVICYCEILNFKNQYLREFMGMVVLIFGLFLGGAPSGTVPTNYYRWIPLDSIRMHVLGAFLFVAGLWLCRPISNLLSCKVFKSISKISYSVYIVHIPVLFLIAPKCFLLLYNKLAGRYQLSCIIAFGVTSIALILSATLFYYLIEKNCSKLSDIVANFICTTRVEKGENDKPEE